jgi:hypothetical protein
MAMLGTASVACGLAVPDAPRITTAALATGAWTNALAFLPLAFEPELERHPAYDRRVLRHGRDRPPAPPDQTLPKSRTTCVTSMPIARATIRPT